MDTLIIVAIFFVGYVIYQKWKDSHSEQIQAKKQAQLLENELEETKNQAILYDCLGNFYTYYSFLRDDLKAFIFSSDYGHPNKIDLMNPHNYPNRNKLWAIKFFYLSDMPSIVKEYNLDKDTVIKEFQACELSTNLWTPQGTRNAVLNRLNIK